MAIFRKVHTSIWSDSFFSNLEKDKKLFYIYLITNERTKQCGVYEITKKQIAFDLGYSMDRVSILLTYFISKGKIRYNEQTFELAVGNWLKYNNSTSPKVQSCINQEFSLVKDTLLIEYVKSMDTRSQEEEEEEQEEDINISKCFDFVKYCNTTIKRNGKERNWRVSDKLSKSFNARLKENYKPEDFAKAIQKAMSDSFHKDSQYKYLTPEFFCRQDKLEKYANL